MLYAITFPVGPPNSGIDLINRATTLTLAAHLEQLRKDGVTPQVVHPLAVQGLLARVGVRDPVVHAAALLHDALEDNPGPRAERTAALIGQHLGNDVLHLVRALSDDPAQTQANRKAQQLQKYAAAPWEVRVIKLADVVAAAQEGPAPQWSPERARAYLSQRVALVRAALKDTCPRLESEFLQALAQPRWAKAGAEAQQAWHAANGGGLG